MLWYRGVYKMHVLDACSAVDTRHPLVSEKHPPFLRRCSWCVVQGRWKLRHCCYSREDAEVIPFIEDVAADQCPWGWCITPTLVRDGKYP